MKLKHILTLLGVSFSLAAVGAVGVAAGEKWAEKDENLVAVEASGSDYNITFKADVSTFESWNPACSGWSFYPMTGTSGNYSAINGYAWNTVSGNATVTNHIASATLGFASTESVTAVIFYFVQNNVTKQTMDMALVQVSATTRDITFDVNPTGWSGNTFTCGGDTTQEAAPEFNLIGRYGTHTWDADGDAFDVDVGTTTATLSSISLKNGDVFKVRKNHNWAVSYGWSDVDEVDITDPLSRGEPCFGDSDDNIAVLHDGTYSFSLNYSTGALSISGTRAEVDSDIVCEIYISSDDGANYTAYEMALYQESTTEFYIQKDLTAGDKMYLKYGPYYYHYNDFKENEGTLKGKQFIAAGQDALALFSGKYTIYFETASGNNFGGWFQFDSVSSAQKRENVINYATYFNDEVGGACDYDGDTTISDLQTAWSNVSTRYTNAPSDVKTDIVAATAEDANAEVIEFVEKYASVYYLRGSSLSSQGGDFLGKGIVPKAVTNFVPSITSETNSFAIIVIIAVSSISLLAVGAYFINKRKENA